jgi:TonB-linked SusC/RagA family outer membrane protein
MTKKTLHIASFLMLFGLIQLNAQNREISGKVVDAKDGSAIIGAAILNVTTNAGDATDENGNFKIKAERPQILQVTYLGYKTESILVGDANFITVKLKSDSYLLDEAVITAPLGMQVKKRNLSYSVQEVSGADIFNTGRQNALASLQGRVAGLTMTPTSGQAGASVSIQLRGPSSIDGNNQPLVVVDGLPIDNRTFSEGALVSDQPNRNADYTNRSADINPNDIESIVVLKGAEAAALYGIDASSGAIIITTKKGQKGKGRVAYDNLFRVENIYRFPDFNRDYKRGLNGIEEPNTLSYFGPKITESTPTFDNVNNFFRNGNTQTHNLSFDGGTEAMTYRLSTGYTNQKGVIPTNDYERLNVRLNTSAKVSSKIDATASFNYTNSNNNSPIRGSSGFALSLIQWPSTDDASNYLNEDGTRRKIVPGLSSEPENPFFNVYNNTNTSRTKRNIGNFSLTYKTTDWLSFTGRFGIDNYSTLGSQFFHPESNSGLAGGGKVETFAEVSLLMNGNLLGTVKKQFGDFKMTLVGGGTFDDRNYEVTSVRGEKLYIPNFVSINNTDPTTQRSKLTVTRQRLVSLLSTFELNYKDYLILNLTGRNDWSSTLPVQNNSFFYPSAGITFVFSDLAPFKNSVLSFGKFRAIYSQTGKDATPYRIKSRLVSQTTTGGGFAFDFYGANPDLKPERTQGYEFGFDLKFLKNRVGVEATYFSNTRYDQIVAQRLSYATGFVFGLLNGGTFSTSGVELSLDVFPVRTQKFEWELIANFTKFTTSVDKLPADQPEFYNSDTWLYGNARASAFVGREDLQRLYPNLTLSGELRGAGSATAIGGFDVLRNKAGQVLINPSTGLPQRNTNFLPIGERNPDFAIGLTNKLSFGDLSVSFLLDLRKGGDVFNGTEMFLWLNGLSSKLVDRNVPYVFTGVLSDGNENTVNPTTNTIQVSPLTRSDFFTSGFPEAYFVEKDINWLRLRDITINYFLPANWLRKSNVISRASIFATATDLWMITNYGGADPNVSGTSAATRGAGSAGFDFASISLPRTLSGGIRVQF